MRRYVLIGTLTALATTTFVVAFGAGVYWLWIFGDDPWPAWAGNVLVAAAYAVGLAVFIGFVVKGYRSNPRAPRRPRDDRPH